MNAPAHIPTDATELTPERLTSLLRDAGHDTVVESVTATPIGSGQMAGSYRLNLGYRGETALPQRMVARDRTDAAAGGRTHPACRLSRGALRGSPYSLEQCLRDYTASLIQASLIIVFGRAAQPTERGDRMFRTMLARSASAVRDLVPGARG